MMRFKKLVVKSFAILSLILLLGLNNASAEEKCAGDGCPNEGGNDEITMNPTEEDKAAENSQNKDANKISDFPLEESSYKETYNPYSPIPFNSLDETKSYAPAKKMEKITRTASGVVTTEEVTNDKRKNIPKTSPEKKLTKEEISLVKNNYLDALIMKAQENGGSIKKDDEYFLNMEFNSLYFSFDTNKSVKGFRINGGAFLNKIEKNKILKIISDSSGFKELTIDKKGNLTIFTENKVTMIRRPEDRVAYDKEKLKEAYDKILAFKNNSGFTIYSVPTKQPTFMPGKKGDSDKPKPVPPVPDNPTLKPPVMNYNSTRTKSKEVQEKVIIDHYNKKNQGWISLPLDSAEDALNGDF